jgi:hypothetical protein
MFTLFVGAHLIRLFAKIDAEENQLIHSEKFLINLGTTGGRNSSVESRKTYFRKQIRMQSSWATRIVTIHIRGSHIALKM